MTSRKISQSGQGLVSVLVAAGVGAMILGFIGDMIVQQGIGQKFLTQKLEMNDFTNNLISTFSKSNSCTCQFANNAATNPNFANFANLKFDSTVIDGSQKISIKKLYSGCLGGANPPIILAEEGARLSNSGLTVDKVDLVNLRPTGGLNEWQGQWQISFQVGGGSVARSVRPIAITQKITINTGAPYSAAAAAISACNGVSSGTGTNDFLAKWSLTQGLLQDSAIIEDSATGNIGIGTAAPAYKLDIKETRADTVPAQYITVYSTQTLNPLSNPTTNFYAIGGLAQSQAGSPINFADITGASNAGFHNGTGTVANIIGTSSFVFNTSTGNPGVAMGSNNYVRNSGNGLISNARGGTFQVFNSVTGTITNSVGVFIGTVAGTNKWSLYANDSSAPSYFAGSVGIGTSSPQKRLHIIGPDGVLASPPAYTPKTILVAENNANAAIAISGAAASLLGIQFLKDGGANWAGVITYNNLTDTMGFGTNVIQDRMIMDSSGRVGIGTLAPQEKLSVSGNIQVAKNVAQPYACDVAHDAVLAITSGYRQCICNSGTGNWVFTSDGTTACIW